MDQVVSNYALVSAAGVVDSVIVWDGDCANWQPPDGFVAVLVPSDVPVSPGWTYADGSFVAPPPPPIVPPTPAEILAGNTITRNRLLAAATLAIAPLQDAVDLDEATAQEIALLKSWKQYRVALNRIDLTAASPSWPIPPQNGYESASAPANQAS